MNIKEIKIPVPWGFVAAKTWGNEKYLPVIALHGYRDNAASFDTLIPQLPNRFYYICLDFPGHGQSTHIPVATFVSFLDFVLTLKLVLDYLDRKKYILLGHSFGGQTAIMFTQMYPEYVLSLIMLDVTYYVPIKPDKCLDEYKLIIERYAKNLKNSPNSVPTYTKEEAVNRMLESRFANFSKNSAEIIMNRCLIPKSEGKYTISTAQHLKYILRPPFTTEYILSMLKHYPIHCPHLLIMAEDGIFYQYVTKDWLHIFKRNKMFAFYSVKGDHDAHLDHPERVAPIITKFLREYYMSKL